MLPIPSISLDAHVQTKLAAYQAQIDALPTHEERAKAAERLFPAYNRKRNPVFRAVRLALTNLCPGTRRCMYCEDSCATDIEHHRPKLLYPEYTFLWENFLYACARCNRPKGAAFAILTEEAILNAAWIWEALARSENRETRCQRLDQLLKQYAAPSGTPALLDPRQENPLEFFILDLRGTFCFRPSRHLDALGKIRAEYTLSLLKLNEDGLPAMRRDAYEACVSHLHRYHALRAQPHKKRERSRVKRAILRMAHRTVWEEMKRLAPRIPELAALFEQVPEALEW